MHLRRVRFLSLLVVAVNDEPWRFRNVVALEHLLLDQLDARACQHVLELGNVFGELLDLILGRKVHDPLDAGRAATWQTRRFKRWTMCSITLPLPSVSRHSMTTSR